MPSGPHTAGGGGGLRRRDNDRGRAPTRYVQVRNQEDHRNLPMPETVGRDIPARLVVRWPWTLTPVTTSESERVQVCWARSAPAPAAIAASRV